MTVGVVLIYEIVGSTVVLTDEIGDNAVGTIVRVSKYETEE